MLGWLWPRCPVGTFEKAWVETRMRWLADRLGPDRLLKAAVVLPTADYFPDPYHANSADARRVMDRLCRYMGVDPAAVELKVSPDEAMPGAAGRYERSARPRGRAVIRVAVSQLDDPEALAATLAHELAHEILLGGGLLDESAEDHEWVTDLLPVFLGVGVFAANSTIREEAWTDGQFHSWKIGRHGYLTSQVLGYALAVFAYARGEDGGAWVRYLRRDAAAALRVGVRYLRRTGDCLFRSDDPRLDRPTPTEAEVTARLTDGRPAARLAALWDVRGYGLTGPGVLEAVTSLLGDPDPDVVADAARTVAAFGPAADPAVPRLVEALSLPDNRVRAWAADSLQVLRLRPAEAVPELAWLAGAGAGRAFTAAARALAAYGTRSDAAVEPLLAGLEAALIACDFEAMEAAAAALWAVTPAPRERAGAYFSGRAKELERRALEALDGVQGRPTRLGRDTRTR